VRHPQALARKGHRHFKLEGPTLLMTTIVPDIPFAADNAEQLRRIGDERYTTNQLVGGACSVERQKVLADGGVEELCEAGFSLRDGFVGSGGGGVQVAFGGQGR
jgi:hypothetical protein